MLEATEEKVLFPGETPRDRSWAGPPRRNRQALPQRGGQSSWAPRARARSRTVQSSPSGLGAWPRAVSAGLTAMLEVNATSSFLARGPPSAFSEDPQVICVRVSA